MIQDVLLFAAALFPLTVGADWLVRGAVGLAQRLGISALVVGLTVVAFGTSAPELVVSGFASVHGLSGTAVGNVMGSTAANVGLIVGLGAIIRPVVVRRRIIARETPVIIFVLSLVVALALNDVIGRLDGFVLVAGWTLYLVYLLFWARRARRGGAAADGGQLAGEELEEHGPPAAASLTPGDEGSEPPGLMWSLVRIGVGMPCLAYGAEWLVEGARGIALALQVSDAVVAATIIALGTSLPELASTLVAAYRRLEDIAIGNVIGSNIFNLGLVLGVAALLRPLELDRMLLVRFVVPALVFSVILIPLALHRGTVDRREGAVLLALYLVYMGWLVIFPPPITPPI